MNFNRIFVRGHQSLTIGDMQIIPDRKNKRIKMSKDARRRAINHVASRGERALAEAWVKHM